MDQVGVRQKLPKSPIQFLNTPFPVEKLTIFPDVHSAPLHQCQRSSAPLSSRITLLGILSNCYTVKMLGASFLPARLRHEHDQPATSNPGYLNRQITQVLQSVARAAFTHPIYTICTVAILASTSYHGLLEGSLFGHTKLGKDAAGTDLTSLVENGRRLRLGEETSWKWQSDNGAARGQPPVRRARDTVNWTSLINL